MRIRDDQYVGENAEKLIFEWDADNVIDPISAPLKASEVGTQTIAIDAGTEQVLVVLHQTASLSGKTPFVAFSLEDTGEGVCTVEGEYVTGVHPEAIAFYECYTSYFLNEDASCTGYGDYSTTYWDFDPESHFE